jgi:hypothetical protein
MRKNINDISFDDIREHWISEDGLEKFVINKGIIKNRTPEYNTYYTNKNGDKVYEAYLDLDLTQKEEGELPVLEVLNVKEDKEHIKEQIKDPIAIWGYTGDTMTLEFSDGARVLFKKM